jgi:hypothetical protein
MAWSPLCQEGWRFSIPTTFTTRGFDGAERCVVTVSPSRLMSAANESVSPAERCQELGKYLITLHKWRKAWRLQGEVVPTECGACSPSRWTAGVKPTRMPLPSRC